MERKIWREHQLEWIVLEHSTLFVKPVNSLKNHPVEQNKILIYSTRTIAQRDLYSTKLVLVFVVPLSDLQASG